MRRKLCILLALCMVLIPLSSAPISYGAPSTGADMLYKYRFIAGYNGDLMTEKPLTRAEACALLAEMYGKKQEAAGYAYLGGFKDVVKDQWFASFVGYAKLNKWVYGYADGRFGPEDSISAQQWAAMLMNALGYTFSYETAISDILALGIVVKGENPAVLKRGEAFEAMWMAVNTPPQGKNRILGEILGRFKGEASAPVVEQIVVEGLRGVGIKVSAALDSASAEALKHYTVTSDAVRDLSVMGAVYDPEKLMVHLTFNEAVPQQSMITVAIENVQSGEGKTLSAQSTVEMTDLTPLQIVSIRALGTQAIKITFSEPVTGTGTDGLPGTKDFKINSGRVMLRSVETASGGREVILRLYTGVSSPVQVEVLNSIKDYARFSPSNLGVQSIPVEKDTLAPTVVGYTQLTPEGVTLIWSEDITLRSTTPSSYYHTVPSYTASSAPRIEGKRMILSFEPHYFSSGKTPVVVQAGAVSDYSGNVCTQQMISVDLPPDTVAPTVPGGAVPKTEKDIALGFSEPMFNRSGALISKASYALFDASGADVSSKIAGIRYDARTYTVHITFSEALKGVYRIHLKDHKDISGNGLAEVSYTFEMKDLTPPDSKKWSARVYDSGRSTQMIKIQFDEPMTLSGKYGIDDVEKYTIAGKALDSLDKTLLRTEVINEDSALLIYYPGATVRGGHTFSPGKSTSTLANEDVVIARVADREGNYVETFSSIINLEGKGILPLQGAIQIEPQVVRVVVGDIVTAVEHLDFQIESGGTGYGIESYSLDYEGGSRSHIDLRLDGVLKMPATLKIISRGTVNAYGEHLDDTMPALRIGDRVGPAVGTANFGEGTVEDVTYTRSNGVVEIEFNEAVDARTVSLLTFTVSDYTIDAITASNNVIRITIASADRSRVQRFDSVIQRVEIRDTAGNGTTGMSLQIQKVFD